AHLLPELRSGHRGRGLPGADSRRAADRDPLPQPGAERGPAAGAAAVRHLRTALLLWVRLPFVRSLAKDRELMGENALGRFDRATTAIALAVVAISVVALRVLAVA